MCNGSLYIFLCSNIILFKSQILHNYVDKTTATFPPAVSLPVALLLFKFFDIYISIEGM